MKIDTEAVDLALTTTRAVRKRLDLERPVDDQIILDCIDIAEQAPTGGNQTSRRWIVVRDPEIKQELARLYREVVGGFMLEARDRLEGTDHPRAKTVSSSAYLVEHLAEVPVIVIATIVGRHDGSGAPGLFDSVIQSGWSFCVALRARGLGTAWTTAILAKAPELKELLGIPDEITEIAMFPVAWTKGTDFRPARRTPARDITFFDGYGRTYESAPGTAPSMADGPGMMVETDIAADIDDVWAAVTDHRPARPVLRRVHRRHLGRRLRRPRAGGHVHRPQPPRSAGRLGRCPASWTCATSRRPSAGVPPTPTTPVPAGASNSNPSWAAAPALIYRLLLGPGPSGLTMFITQNPTKEPRIIANRLRVHRTNMQRVVNGIKAHVEAAS